MKNILGKYTGFVPVGGFCWNFHPFANSTIWGLAIKLQEWLYCSWIPKEGNVKQCSNYHTIALISLASKVMLKILQARFQQYMNHELPGVQVGFRKSRRTRDQIANIHWIVEKESWQKHLLLIYWLHQRLCVDHNKLWHIFKEMGILYHPICLLRNLYACQEATVRTWHETMH